MGTEHRSQQLQEDLKAQRRRETLPPTVRWADRDLHMTRRGDARHIPVWSMCKLVHVTLDALRAGLAGAVNETTGDALRGAVT